MRVESRVRFLELAKDEKNNVHTSVSDCSSSSSRYTISLHSAFQKDRQIIAPRLAAAGRSRRPRKVKVLIPKVLKRTLLSVDPDTQRSPPEY